MLLAPEGEGYHALGRVQAAELTSGTEKLEHFILPFLIHKYVHMYSSSVIENLKDMWNMAGKFLNLTLFALQKCVLKNVKFTSFSFSYCRIRFFGAFFACMDRSVREKDPLQFYFYVAPWIFVGHFKVLKRLKGQGHEI